MTSREKVVVDLVERENGYERRTHIEKTRTISRDEERMPVRNRRRKKTVDTKPPDKLTLPLVHSIISSAIANIVLLPLNDSLKTAIEVTVVFVLSLIKGA